MAWRPGKDPFQFFKHGSPSKQNEIIFAILIMIIVGTLLYILSFYVA